MARARREKPRALTASEEALWRAWTRAMLVAPRAVEADLIDSSRLNFAEYHVLVYLSDQPDHSLRMTELSNLGALSPSGMTRVVERLTEQGLIERRRSTLDGRGHVATLTAEGMKRIKAAWPDHVESVRARVLDHLAPLDRDALIAALTAVAAASESARTGRLPR